MPSTHEELLADYIRAADRDDWFVARQYCNSAGCGPMSEECHREDFSPAQKEMWVKLYEIAMKRKTDEWREYRRELWPKLSTKSD